MEQTKCPRDCSPFRPCKSRPEQWLCRGECILLEVVMKTTARFTSIVLLLSQHVAVVTSENVQGTYRLLCLGVVGVNVEPDAHCILLLGLLRNMLIQRSEEPSSPVVCMHVHRLYPPQLPVPPATSALKTLAFPPQPVPCRMSKCGRRADGTANTSARLCNNIAVPAI